MNMAGPARGANWPEHGRETAERVHTGASMGVLPGAPPGNKVLFSMDQGPSTWMIGQWHPGNWDMNQNVISWYLIGKDELCDWTTDRGEQKFAQHIHGDSIINRRYFDQVMSTGQAGNIIENPHLPIWNISTKGKGKYQKGSP